MTILAPGAPLARRWLWPARSRARVALPAKDLASVERVARQLFGRALRRDEYAGLGGAPDDGLVRVGVTGARLWLEVVDPRRFRYASAHLVCQGRFGPVLASGGLRILDPRLRGKGIGLQMARRQLIASRRLGVRSILAHGGRGAGEIGYYFGPRLGFDSPLPEQVARSLPSLLRPARSILDLMQSQSGRDWWREHGVELDLVFDLGRDSRCWSVFWRYLSTWGQAGIRD